MERQRRLIDVEKLARLPSFYLPTVSWSRRFVAYYGNQTGRMELYVLDLETENVEQVTEGEVPRSIRYPVAWGRDDRTLVVPKDTDGDEQNDLYLFDLQKRELTQLTNVPKKQEIPVEVSPDNQWVTMLTNREGQLNLYKVRLEDGEVVRLTNYPNPVFDAVWSPDGHEIAYVVNESKDLRNWDVYTVKSDGTDAHKVWSVKDGSQDEVQDWSRDGRLLAVTSDASGVPRPGTLDLSAGEVRWLGEAGIEEHAFRFSDSGRLLATVRNEESVLSPVVYDLEDGVARPLRFPQGLAFGSNFVNGDADLLTLYTTPTRRPELVLYNLRTDKMKVLVRAEYGEFDPRIFVDAEYVKYPSFDGRPIASIVYRPRDLRPGERVPAVVYVHGGPTGQWFFNFDPFAQFMADRGYVVLMPNVRGSTGYGVEFRDLNRMDWGGGDLEDVTYGAEWLRKQPDVEGKRLGIFGGSYGGFMTYMAITKKPEYWKAAVPWVGITHLRKLYESDMEHFKYYFKEQMGDPDENKELWEDRSAVNFAQNMQAKLLILHGVNDPRCPIEQARIFKERLDELGRKEGVDYEYVELTEEGHGSTDIEQRVRVFRHLAKFFEKEL